MDRLEQSQGVVLLSRQVMLSKQPVLKTLQQVIRPPESRNAACSMESKRRRKQVKLDAR